METEIGLLREETRRRDRQGEDESEELEREKALLEKYIDRDYKELLK
jgi:hypothetical protein